MIHKFTSNDNKGNVNSVEVGSTYTKLGRVAPPVEDTDAANKEYVDSVAGGSGGVLVVHMVYDEEKDIASTDKTWKEIHDAPMAVIVDDNEYPGSSAVKSINLVAYVSSKNGNYFVVYYVHSKLEDRVTVGEVILVTDSENGYLTYSE